MITAAAGGPGVADGHLISRQDGVWVREQVQVVWVVWVTGSLRHRGVKMSRHDNPERDISHGGVEPWRQVEGTGGGPSLGQSDVNSGHVAGALPL